MPPLRHPHTRNDRLHQTEHTRTRFWAAVAMQCAPFVSPTATVTAYGLLRTCRPSSWMTSRYDPATAGTYVHVYVPFMAVSTHVAGTPMPSELIAAMIWQHASGTDAQGTKSLTERPAGTNHDTHVTRSRRH